MSNNSTEISADDLMKLTKYSPEVIADALVDIHNKNAKTQLDRMSEGKVETKVSKMRKAFHDFKENVRTLKKAFNLIRGKNTKKNSSRTR